MEFKEIKELLRLVNQTNLTEVVIDRKEFTLKIKKETPANNVVYTQQPAHAIAPIQVEASAPQPQAVAPSTPASGAGKESTASSPDGNLVPIKSPMIGTFYRSASPEDDAFVKVGDYVTKGQVICIIEAMKLFNEIEAETEGKIAKILIEDARPVEYDQDLFLIEPAG